jgi:hypothetical protein
MVVEKSLLKILRKSSAAGLLLGVQLSVPSQARLRDSSSAVRISSEPRHDDDDALGDQQTPSLTDIIAAPATDTGDVALIKPEFQQASSQTETVAAPVTETVEAALTAPEFQQTTFPN